MNDQPNTPILKSFAFHKDKCFLVSTIERTYDTYESQHRCLETLVWEYDWENSERGELIHQAGSLLEHQAICRCIIATGETPDADNLQHKRFFL